jgi:TetR/AcrR family transcriptional regulator of autoinduction and epiphytic fitness
LPKKPESPPRVDGRTARAVRTRAAILDAMLDLIDEGTPLPTAGEVAARAGVALRSIRQHFESREALFISASERHAARVDADPVRTDGGPIEERARRLATARANVLEQTSPIRRAATMRADTSPALADALQRPIRERRREVASIFAPELAALDGKAKADLLDALDLVAGGRAWDTLRVEMGRTTDQAERIVRAALIALARSST